MDLMKRTDIVIKGNDDIGRYYLTPDGKFYSVTTMLGQTKDMTGLDEWRDRFGHREADLHTKRAGQTGSNFHSLCEQEITKTLFPPGKLNPDPLAKKLFRQAQPIIENNLNVCYYSEVQLFNKTLQLAGTCDAVVMWKDKHSVLDFKSCGYVPDHAEDPFIDDYWIQIEIYRHMARETFQWEIPQSVLLFSSKKTARAAAFVLADNRKKDIAEKAIKRIRMFRKSLTNG